jgi:hypothetical protein
MKNIKEIMSSYKFFNGIKIENLMILNSIWKNEMKDYSLFCDIYSIEKKKLIIKVKNPVIRNEIYMRKDEILKKINSYFKTKFINDINFI